MLLKNELYSCTVAGGLATKRETCLAAFPFLFSCLLNASINAEKGIVDPCAAAGDLATKRETCSAAFPFLFSAPSFECKHSTKAENKKSEAKLHSFCCGEKGIRTPGTRKSTTVFETAPFDHSGISPRSFSAIKNVFL